MKQLFDYAGRSLAKSDWKDLAMIKLSVFSVGVLAGTYVAGEAKGVVRIIALIVFVIAMIPVMITLWRNQEQGHIEEIFIKCCLC